MVKIRYSDEFVCPTCGRHTAMVCHTDGTHQAHCMICDVYYDVEIAPTTNYDRIISKTPEELADFLWSIGANPATGNYYLNGKLLFSCADGNGWLDWLKQEATE